MAYHSLRCGVSVSAPLIQSVTVPFSKPVLKDMSLFIGISAGFTVFSSAIAVNATVNISSSDRENISALIMVSGILFIFIVFAFFSIFGVVFCGFLGVFVGKYHSNGYCSAYNCGAKRNYKAHIVFGLFGIV